jgi:hypothetical protein
MAPAIMSLSSCDIQNMSREGDDTEISTQQQFENSLRMLIDRYRHNRTPVDVFVPGLETVLREMREQESDGA